MLEPRKSDIPALFLVLVVLPVVLYIILGKWSESVKRKGRVNLIVEEPLEESYRAEQMAAASAVPLVVPPPSPSFRECARCHGPATTRCSRCKSVRYCSGKCQIIHWRQGHKEECLPPDNFDSYIACASVEKADTSKDFRHYSQYAEYSGSSQLPMQDNAQFDVTFGTSYPGETSAGTSSTSSSAAFDCSEQSKLDKRISERRNSRKTDKEISETRKRAASISTDANLRSTPNYSKDVNTRNKLRGNGSTNSGYIQAQSHVIDGSLVSEGYSDQRCELQPNLGFSCLNGESLYSAQGSLNEVGLGLEYSVPAGVSSNCSEDLSRRNNFPHNHSSNGSIRSKSEHVIKSAKSKAREVREQVQPAKLRKGHGFDESAGGTTTFSSAHEADGATRTGLLKSFGVNSKSKMSKQESEIIIHAPRNVKALFPFEVFTRFFELEIFDLAPRGLLNCGNSCYANAVLQCLTCTKPLVAYLLSRTHSRACSLKNWCLMCELEQHVMALREVGGPLSPSRILSHMRGINCQIGDGSQEDAHEFLRLLVASMQSICLEEVGGENQVHPILHETTFVQQTFGGRLRSRVVCLTCHHESERYENIMDLTLEIFGWVESLEDALTQFTTFEDLDGDNMYRCGRCASYVRAKKQLRIDEAPNILTIVLKRFQEGNYGKINKCITFPDMLDMVRFMTGTNDIPPLYMLYGVVVHVDTLNASFSGHYVSYVKDLQGNWFRIDDSVVQPVPTSQVMSEGAYILFYKRSSPRPPRAYIRKPTKNEAAKHSKPFGQNVQRANRSTRPVEVYAEPNLMEYSDAASSDWSLFTSSDDASFTSESTRDSFSTVEYSDTCHADPFSSVFGPHSTRDRPSQRTVSCRMFSGSKPVTRYISEQTEFIIESDNIIDPLDEIHIGGYTRQVSVPFNEAYLSNSGYQNFVNYERSSDGFVRTFSDLHL